ncbi:MAG: hypothetical protein E7068_09525 [Lentimicrobiaceae bacterium]|nr:hypothetical protein [Lentimicrobiaceae bacterium]
MNNQQDEVPQRISQDNDRAQVTRNGRMEEITIRLRGSSETINTISSGSKSIILQQEIESKIAENYAKENNIWLPLSEVFHLGIQGQSGNENDTYFSSDGFVYKVNNLMNSVNISSLFERLMIHNQIFPETAYELIGFTGFEGRSAYPILRQRAIKNPSIATPEEIEDYMISLGFKKINKTTFTNDEITISDLQSRNVLKSDSGNIYVIDAEFSRCT